MDSAAAVYTDSEKVMLEKYFMHVFKVLKRGHRVEV